MTSADKDYEESYYNSLRMKVYCSQCNDQEKEVALPCGHLICNKCLESLVKARQRSCPIDRTKFTDGDLRKIYLA